MDEKKDAGSLELKDEGLAGATGGSVSIVLESADALNARALRADAADEENDQLTFCPFCGRTTVRCTCWQ